VGPEARVVPQGAARGGRGAWDQRAHRPAGKAGAGQGAGRRRHPQAGRAV